MDEGFDNVAGGRSATSLEDFGFSETVNLQPSEVTPEGQSIGAPMVSEPTDVVVAGLNTASAKSFNEDGMMATVAAVGETTAVVEWLVVPNIPQKVSLFGEGVTEDVAGIGAGEWKPVLKATPIINVTKASKVTAYAELN